MSARVTHRIVAVLCVFVVAVWAHGVRADGSINTPSRGSGFTNAGSGLTSSGLTVNVGQGSGIIVTADAVSADTSYLQRIVTGTCAAGSAMQTIGIDGSVTCTATYLTTSSDFTGTGSAGSPLDLSTNVTVPGIASIAGTAGSNTLTVNSSDKATIFTWRALTASTRDNTASIYGYADGTMVTAGNIYSYGVRGESQMTLASGGGNVHNWGLFGKAGFEGTETVAAYEHIGVDGLAWGASAYNVGLSGRSGGGQGVMMGAYGQADTTSSTAPTFGTFGYARTGNKRVGVMGVAPTGGSTSNIGVWARLGTYSETPPSGSYALYVDGVSTFSDDATFESGTCVINSLGITCGGTLITPSATISGVTAGAGLTGGGTTGTVTLDVGAGTGIQVNANDVTLNMTAQSCSAGQHISAATSVGVFTCSADTGITNSAGNNVLPKSNGTNLVASLWTDNATTTAYNTSSFTVNTTGNGAFAGTLNSVGNLTENSVRVLVSSSNTSNFLPKQNGTTNRYADSLLQDTSTLLKYNGNNFTVTASNGNINSLGGISVTTGMGCDSASCDFEINTNKFNVTASNGNTSIAGTLVGVGAVTFNNNAGGTADLTVKKQTSGTAFSVAAASGNTTVGGTLDVASTLTVATSQLLDVKDRTQTRFLKGASGTGLITVTSCGTGSPSADTHSNNLAGKFTTGTGASACTVTFDGTWPVAPWCSVSKSDGTIVAHTNFTETTTTIPITAGLSAATVYYYQCTGGS